MTITDTEGLDNEAPEDIIYRRRVDAWEAERSLAKARKIADRTRTLGLEGGYEVWLDTETEKRRDRLGREYTVTHKVVCWQGQPVRLPGWRFVAVVEWLGDDPITRMLPGYEGEMIDRAWIAESVCDHCGTKRRRNHVLVVEDTEGTRLRVGSSCSQDFLGWRFSPSFFPEVPEDEERGTRMPVTVSTRYLLETAAMMARGFGWVPSSRASEMSQESTADRIRTLLWAYGKPLEHLQREMREREVAPSDQDALDVEAALAWLAEQSPNSEYIANLQVAVAQPNTRTKELGLVVSAVPVALKALDRQRERAEAEKAEGVVEERYADDKARITLNLKVVGVSSWDSDYGTLYMHTFVGDGHRFQWKTGTRCLDKGETYSITGTVKGVHEYQGRLYTVLTRCKIN